MSCTVEGCEARVKARTMCEKHYREWMRSTPVEQRGPTPKRAGGPVNNSKHGTESRYARGCRCDPCRDAHRDYFAQRREARLCGPIPSNVQHGKASTQALDLCENMKEKGVVV